MHVSVESLGKFERKLTVSLPHTDLDQRVRNRVQELSRTMRLKGFRPGKVPVKVVEQRYGPQIREEELSELIRDGFGRAIEQEKLRLAAAPVVEPPKAEAGQDIEFVARFDVLPEVPEIDVSSLNIEQIESEIVDQDIHTMIETLRQQRRQWEETDAAAEAGNLALFEFSADYDGGRYPEGEGRERLGTVIGSGILSEEIDTALVGMAAGDEKSVELSFPDPFRIEQLAGKAAKVEIKAIRIQQSRLPDVDDAFIAQFGIEEGGIERFRTEVRANLEREMRSAIMSQLKTEVADKLVNAYEFDLPESLIESEARSLFQRSQRRQNDSQEAANPSAQQLEALKAPARRRVLAGLLISELARANKISVDRKRLVDAINSIASTYEQPEQVFELYSKDADLMAGIQSQVMEDQVVEWVAEHAKTEHKKLPFSELMKVQAGV